MPLKLYDFWIRVSCTLNLSSIEKRACRVGCTYKQYVSNTAIIEYDSVTKFSSLRYCTQLCTRTRDPCVDWTTSDVVLQVFSCSTVEYDSVTKSFTVLEIVV